MGEGYVNLDYSHEREVGKVTAESRELRHERRRRALVIVHEN